MSLTPNDLPPITDDDETIRSALADANVPSLMNAMAHISGDLSLLRGRIRPDLAAFVDQQCGISEENQREAREVAFDRLTAFRDNGSQVPRELTDQEIEEMIGWMVGVPLPPEYTDFLVQELAMRGQDPYATPALDKLDKQAKLDFKVVVIGAGMSGLLAAHRLQQANISYTVLDKNPEVGGTWFENSYPGCRVDSPNHTYCYSFRPHRWPNYYSPRAVLRDYFNKCADEFGIRSNIRLNSEVREAVWDQEKRRWMVRFAGAHGGSSEQVLEANALICAVGQLNRPKLPHIPGLERFSGPSFHSARWDHNVPLQGQRIGVVGTGASAFQFIPEIAKQAAKVTVFQRTPPWVRPTEDYHDEVSAGKHWLLNNVPYYAKWYRFLMFWLAAEGMLEAAKVDPSWDNGGLSVSQANEDLRLLLLENLNGYLGDNPELSAKATPAYPPAGKRMLFDNGTWFKTLKRNNVELVTDPILEVLPEGISTSTTKGSESHEFDALILGTGFETTRMLSSLEIRGRDGRSLQQVWDDDPRAYLGITVPGFPNFFCLYGPNTNIVVNGSIVFFSECEVRYLLGCLGLLIGGRHQSMDCREQALADYIERIDRGNRSMAWGVPEVRSWYKNEAGRVTQNWPFSLVDFWAQSHGPKIEDYRFE